MMIDSSFYIHSFCYSGSRNPLCKKFNFPPITVHKIQSQDSLTDGIIDGLKIRRIVRQTAWSQDPTEVYPTVFTIFVRIPNRFRKITVQKRTTVPLLVVTANILPLSPFFFVYTATVFCRIRRTCWTTRPLFVNTIVQRWVRFQRHQDVQNEREGFQNSILVLQSELFQCLQHLNEA